MKLKNIFKKHYDSIVGFLIFVSYRLYFTQLLFSKRGVPPEPDDSYFYLASASHFLTPQTFEEFRLLPFSIWLNLISIFTGGNLEAAYKFNFFMGPVLMFLALIYFLKKLEVNRKIRLLLIIILSLYLGSGAYHGFYWVVPSFYQLALFFVLLGILISQKTVKFWKVFLLSLAFIFSHPTSIFASLIFFLYPISIYLMQRGKTSIPKNLAFLALSLPISFVIYYLLAKLFPAASSPQSFQTASGLLADFFAGQLKPISASVIWKEYFAIFFFHPLSVLAYLLLFYFTYHARQFKILAIFLSSLVLVFIGVFIPYGARTLGFLWPTTFIIFGYAIFGFYQWPKKFLPFLKYFIFPALAFLFFSSTTFNLIMTKSINLRKNYHWDRSCPQKIKTQPVFFDGLESYHAFVLYGIEPKNTRLLTRQNLPELSKEGTYIVITQEEKLPNETLSKIEKFLTTKITRRASPAAVNYPQNTWTQTFLIGNEVSSYLEKNGLFSQGLYDCGHFQVYRVKKI